ncbi:Macrophage colony-stimulating factor 1 receptor 2 [Hypsibius exemplaris]|uniref:Macrophage colony-stimulating factor 1 receptor 2 n=1 Tax=Hypsibius exemplaris TaxID=2072580 RepID=A0A1W0XFS6_HYPEX|nr:Macrophage colony-stimulating factor 1 receptor 2 [Hypsibius exemplaris]
MAFSAYVSLAFYLALLLHHSIAADEGNYSTPPTKKTSALHGQTTKSRGKAFDPLSSVLRSGESMQVGQVLWSPQRSVQLRMQPDEDLRLHRQCDNEAAWQTDTKGVTPLAQVLTMQADGNLALHAANNQLVWSTNTSGQPFSGVESRVQDEGILCLAHPGSRCLWSSGGYGVCDPVYPGTFDVAKVILKSGERLTTGMTVQSNGQTCSLAVQLDGDVVLRRACDGVEMYSIRHAVPASMILSMGVASSGNLQVYRANGAMQTIANVETRQRWDPVDGTDLRIGDNCALCLYKNGVCLWTSSRSLYKCPLGSSVVDVGRDPDSTNITTAPSRVGNQERELQAVLESGDSLFVGDTVWSPGRVTRLTMQADGNLVLYRECDGKSIWASDTNYNSEPPQIVTMQENGNLAIYNPNQYLLWSTGTTTPRFAGARLRVQDSGSLCIENRQGVCLWNSGGFALCHPAPSPHFEEAIVILNSGEKLIQGKTVYSKHRPCNLTIQSNGNMMLYRACDGAAVFSLRYGVGYTENRGYGYKYISDFSINENGNLLLTDSITHMIKNVNLRADDARGSAYADLHLSDEECRLCVFKDGFCLWTSHALLYECPGTVDPFGTLLQGSRRAPATETRVHLTADLWTVQFESQDEGFRSVYSRYMCLLEIPKQNLQLSATVLGKGEFGIVYKGLAHDLPTVSKSPTVVAAKTLTGMPNPEQSAQFGAELEVMMKCGHHINIVNILGICMQERPFLLLEYCDYGSLLTFLRQRQSSFYSHLDELGNLASPNENDAKAEWTQICVARGWDSDEQSMEANMLNTEELIKFGHQIARGMEHLVSRFIIHRDLAARNILVTNRRVMKISDFGLARQGSHSYTVSNVFYMDLYFIALPILWMPPDAILYRRFSEKSDVWAFGVLLWEMFSLGLVPFDRPDVAKFSATAFAEWLLEGNQLPRPLLAPLSIARLMQLCWDLTPDTRPTFTDLWKNFDQVLCETDNGRSYLLLETYVPDRRLTDLDQQLLECLKDRTKDKESEDARAANLAGEISHVLP